MTKRICIIAALLFSLPAFAQQAPEVPATPQPLTDEELVKLLKPTATIRGTSTKFKYEQQLLADGTVSTKSTPVGGGSERKAEGRWWIAEAKLCIHYDRPGWINACRGIQPEGKVYRYVGDHVIEITKP